MSCVLCGHEIELLFKTKEDLSVLNDARLLPMAISIYKCRECSHVQKKLDEHFKSVLKDIFRDYKFYELSDGVEQVKFYDGVPKTRSSILVENIEAAIPPTGDLLDLGCGNGSFLKAFGNRFKDWNLYGFDLTGNFEDQIRKIGGVKDFFSGEIADIGRKFDLISLVHVFQHVETPGTLLRTIKSLLAKDGVVLILVPYLSENIFDVLRFEQLSHFNKRTIFEFSREFFEYACFPKKQLYKEITILLSQSGNWLNRFAVEQPEFGDEKFDLEFLNRMIDEVKNLRKPMGVFGTAGVGTYVGGVLGKNLAFFVDEDESRTNKFHCGKKILSPGEVDPDIEVYLPFGARESSKIKSKFKNIRFITPQ